MYNYLSSYSFFLLQMPHAAGLDFDLVGDPPDPQ